MIIEKIKSLNKRYYPKKIYFAPEWIVLGVNNICNLHCKMCDVGIEFKDSNFYQNLMGSSPLNMPLELIQNVFDQTSKYFPHAKIGYAFTEPLIYPHLIESLKYADDKNLYTTITTNALNLKDIANELINVNLNELFVSLDGPAEVHNQIRGHKSSFERAVAGIEKLIENEKRPHVSVYCVITEWNIGHLKRFADFFEKYPLKQLGFMHTNYTPPHIADIHNKYYHENYPATESNMEETDLNNYDLETLNHEIEEIRKNNYPYPVTFSPNLNSKEKLDIFFRKPEILIGKNCNDVSRTMMVKSDGTIIPAHGRCYQLTIGNLYHQTLKEIWNSKVISQFRSDLNKAGGLLPACSRCCSAF